MSSAQEMPKPQDKSLALSAAIQSGCLPSIKTAATRLAWAVIDHLPLFCAKEPTDQDRELVNHAAHAIRNGADMHAPFPERTQAGYGSLFEEACRAGHVPLIKLMVDMGADVNHNKSGTTPLIEAISNRNETVAYFLVASGADIHARNTEGATALSAAMWNDCAEIQEWLHGLGADVLQKNDCNQNLLQQALLRTDYLSTQSMCAALRRLVLWGVDPNEVSDFGTSALEEARQRLSPSGQAPYLRAIEAAMAEKLQRVLQSTTVEPSSQCKALPPRL